jgi:hypothetical protein
LSISLNVFDPTAFLGKNFGKHKSFYDTENDVNKMPKKISLEFLSLLGWGKPKKYCGYFDLECKLTIHKIVAP